MRTGILALFGAGVALQLLSAGAAFGQIGGPVLGYVPDGGRIRPVYGIPATGAAGPFLDQNRDYAQIAISPRQDYALAIAADNGEALVIVPGGSPTHLDGVAPGASRMLTSPRGSAAVL